MQVVSDGVVPPILRAEWVPANFEMCTVGF
jgi:hypothetical protein